MPGWRLNLPPTINEIVGFNLRRLREELGLTQEQAGQLIEHFIGAKWSKQTFGAAEGGVKREFSVTELIGLARAFGVPLAELLQPPPDQPLLFAYDPHDESVYADWDWKTSKGLITAQELAGVLAQLDDSAFVARLRAIAAEIVSEKMEKRQ
jgi:transcriptional regulator with XRE-family HTH domain